MVSYINLQRPFQKSKYFLWYLTILLEIYLTYENGIILGDFNIEAESNVM